MPADRCEKKHCLPFESERGGRLPDELMGELDPRREGKMRRQMIEHGLQYAAREHRHGRPYRFLWIAKSTISETLGAPGLCPVCSRIKAATPCFKAANSLCI